MGDSVEPSCPKDARQLESDAISPSLLAQRAASYLGCIERDLLALERLILGSMDPLNPSDRSKLQSMLLQHLLPS